jgi:hypothetical protein
VVSVWDQDQLSADDLVGSTSLELRDLVPEMLEDDWYPLQNPALGHKVASSAVRLQVLLRPTCSVDEGNLPVATCEGREARAEGCLDNDGLSILPMHKTAPVLLVTKESPDNCKEGLQAVSTEGDGV